ncbi:hypothetical protein ABH931_004482 [Streptacidiphilus sp. MAP12-33]|uniref:hypothetical protein n=1 Tax=Streptacidiphilus sp. MAP12-33 TaxID=3156266 RepID=UPI0035198FBF
MALLYVAFAVVALWLIGELLLQRRAPLHWRGLALVGFLVLVAGVVQGSLPLIGAGVLAFGAGQVLATMAVKRSTGTAHWSLVAPERVPVVGRLFGGEEPAPAPKGRSRAARPQPDPEPQSPPQPQFVAEPTPEPLPEAVEATAVYQGDSVYYGRAEQEYGYSTGQQVAYTDPYADPYTQQYQPQYQEYAPYEQQQPYPQYEQQYQQYPEYQQQYAAAYEQQQPYQDYQQQAYGTYEQAGYYPQDPQHHAPQG